MKKNLEYYQHFADSDQHPKFKMLRTKFGWSGEGRFWALNNRIALSEDCSLDITKKYNLASIAEDLSMSMEELSEFIDYLHEECELIIKENGFVTTGIVQDNLERVSDKRKRNQSDYRKKLKESVRICQPTEIHIQTSESIQTKVKETKVKKTKVKDTSQEFEMFWNSYPRKKSKGDAETAFAKIDPDKELLPKIMAAIENQKSSPDWIKENGKFIPYPATWLNKKCWEDVIIPFVKVSPHSTPTHDEHTKDSLQLIEQGFEVNGCKTKDEYLLQLENNK